MQIHTKGGLTTGINFHRLLNMMQQATVCHHTILNTHTNLEIPNVHVSFSMETNVLHVIHGHYASASKLMLI